MLLRDLQHELSDCFHDNPAICFVISHASPYARDEPFRRNLDSAQQDAELSQAHRGGRGGVRGRLICRGLYLAGLNCVAVLCMLC